jgi:hypothetical protein
MTKEKSEMGKRSRKSGKVFENNVRRDLEKRGWIVCKWTNTIDFNVDAIIPAKSKYNPFTKRVMSEGSGFPDFVMFKRTKDMKSFSVWGAESKKAKYLDKEEKRMMQWYLDHNTFGRLYVAYPLKNKMSDKKSKGIAYYEIQKTKVQEEKGASDNTNKEEV